MDHSAAPESLEKFDDLVRGKVQHARTEPGIQANPKRARHDLVGDFQRAADAVTSISEIRLSSKIAAKQQSRPDFIAIEKMRELFAGLRDPRRQRNGEAEPGWIASGRGLR